MRNWLLLLLLLAPQTVFAQYKNAEFGGDISYWLVTKPSLKDSSGNYLRNDKLPFRASNGIRLGVESGFKLSEDHFWLIPRFNFGFLSYDGTDAYDRAAADEMGTLFAIQPEIAVRYVILTDQIRPYIQLGFSYMHLFSFSSTAGSNCAAGICSDPTVASGSNSSVYLPHSNIGGFHVQPGIEFIVARDIAIKVMVDMQYWLVFGAADNMSIAPGAGMTFFL
jgi:hypothetical protein